MKYRILVESPETGVLVDDEADGFILVRATREEKNCLHPQSHIRGLNRYEYVGLLEWLRENVSLELIEGTEEANPLTDET